MDRPVEVAGREQAVARVIFAGKTGAGKSSLMNAAFGLQLKTDNAIACTAEIAKISVTVASDHSPPMRCDVIDTPGFSQSRETEARYRKLYRREFPKAHHIVWVVQAHPRIFRPDQVELRRFSGHVEGKLSFALTHIDGLGPGDWDTLSDRPSAAQRETINDLIDALVVKFADYVTVSVSDFVPCSSVRRYGLDDLRQRIVSAASADKLRGPAERGGHRCAATRRA
jgi:uncharacterized protein